MPFKEPEEIIIITSTINVHMYIENLHDFIDESWIGDDEISFRTNGHLVTGPSFLEKKHIKSIISQ